MESEKVKDIKEALASSFCPYIDYVDTIGEPKMKRLELRSVINLIKELESENERLQNKNYQLEQDLGQCENGYKLELHTARDQMYSANEDLEKAKNRIAELEKENKDYYDRLNNLQAYIDNHEEIWKGNTNNALKQFAERLKEKVKNFCGTEYENAYYDVTKSFACNDIDETLKAELTEV